MENKNIDTEQDDIDVVGFTDDIDVVGFTLQAIKNARKTKDNDNADEN